MTRVAQDRPRRGCDLSQWGAKKLEDNIENTEP